MLLSQAIKIIIYELCKQNKITINKLCIISGITQSTLANINSRPNTNITVLTVMRICRGLNISIEDFFNSSLFNIENLEAE